MATMQQPLTINITETAAEHVRHFMMVDGKEGYTVRVGVKGGGCSSLTYDLNIVPEAGETDKKSYVFLAGTVLDYSGGLNGKGFVFNNPNAKTACGCGTSFSV
jgi:iron-sulfur cluster assembly protein